MVSPFPMFDSVPSFFPSVRKHLGRILAIAIILISHILLQYFHQGLLLLLFLFMLVFFPVLWKNSSPFPQVWRVRYPPPRSG